MSGMGGREWEGGREREREKKIWKECGREIEAEGGRRENQKEERTKVLRGEAGEEEGRVGRGGAGREGGGQEGGR